MLSAATMAPFLTTCAPLQKGFVRLASAGIGYGMMPQLQVGELMASGQLASVAPGYSLAVPLYWHFGAIAAH
ncbi:hypothetical protein HORIV_13980 [Vreelandella olivaria]|uniref:Uncharacterized protein n=1 Tax=Vreelandella olivaria TaxID=390919 RepID=A0ABM7GEJ8_9GAMM|nr:hypothetical protein HORIV_13980 [Halomonas olivaria]